MGEGAISALDLVAVHALTGTSEVQRDTLVQSAEVLVCPAGVALPDFALAVVLEGEVTGTAGADGPLIARRSQGAISLRGTLDAPTLAHFTVSADDTTLALWSEAALAWALRAGAAAAEELRLDGDRWLAWSVIMRSSLASKLPEDVRLRMVERLTPRALAPRAELVAEGQPVGGLLLVGYGTVVLDRPASPLYSAGDFVFADAALSAGRASATARAGGQGAIVLTADRRTTQELYATEPLLLELLAASF
jgi:CRP-like cAMP-binding protein